MSEETKLYRTTLTLSFLSDRPVDDFDPEDLVNESMNGDLVMRVVNRTSKEITAVEMAGELIKAGSEPSFFQVGDRAAFLASVAHNAVVKWVNPHSDNRDGQLMTVIDIEGARIKNEATVLTVKNSQGVTWNVQAAQVFPVD